MAFLLWRSKCFRWKKISLFLHSAPLQQPQNSSTNHSNESDHLQWISWAGSQHRSEWFIHKSERSGATCLCNHTNDTCWVYKIVLIFIFSRYIYFIWDWCFYSKHGCRCVLNQFLKLTIRKNRFWVGPPITRTQTVLHHSKEESKWFRGHLPADLHSAL